MNFLDQYEQDKPRKHTISELDRLICITNQQCHEMGWNMILEAQPRAGKSEKINVYNPVAWTRTHRNFRTGVITHGQELANKFCREFARLIEKSDIPLEYRKANACKIAGSESMDPTYWASGIEGGHTGKGCNRLVLDDLVKSGRDALSEKTRRGIITDVISTALNRVERHNKIDGAVTILQARLHEGDPIGWFVEESGMDYVRLHVPCYNDDGTKAYIENTYTGEKKFIRAYDAIVPDRFPRDKVEAIQYASSEYFFASQWLQNPSLGINSYFDLSRCPTYRYPNVDAWWLACDFAQTATKDGSQTAFVAIGHSQQDGGLKVLGVHAARERQDVASDSLLHFIDAMRRLTGLREVTCIVERAAAGFGVIDRFDPQDEQGNRLPGEHILNILPIRPIASKEARAGEVCYLVNRGSVQLPESAPWLEAFKDELEGFPLVALNDRVDAFVHALKFVVSSNEFKNPESEEIVIYDSIQAERLLNEPGPFDDYFKKGGW